MDIIRVPYLLSLIESEIHLLTSKFVKDIFSVFQPCRTTLRSEHHTELSRSCNITSDKDSAFCLHDTSQIRCLLSLLSVTTVQVPPSPLCLPPFIMCHLYPCKMGAKNTTRSKNVNALLFTYTPVQPWYLILSII